MTRPRTAASQYKREYMVWYEMKRRCRNPIDPHFDRYGGRGITVCDRWNDFATFLADMGPRPSDDHSIERVDNAGPYAPDNCKWATRIEQGQNKRNNHLIAFEGRTQSLNAWAREFGMPRCRLTMRLRRGWSMADAKHNQSFRAAPLHPRTTLHWKTVKRLAREAQARSG